MWWETSFPKNFGAWKPFFFCSNNSWNDEGFQIRVLVLPKWRKCKQLHRIWRCSHTYECEILNFILGILGSENLCFHGIWNQRVSRVVESRPQHKETIDNYMEFGGWVWNMGVTCLRILGGGNCVPTTEKIQTFTQNLGVQPDIQGFESIFFQNSSDEKKTQNPKMGNLWTLK